MKGERTWSGRTGFCMTGYHAACPGASTMLRPCTCECHGGESKQSAA